MCKQHMIEDLQDEISNERKAEAKSQAEYEEEMKTAQKLVDDLEAKKTTLEGILERPSAMPPTPQTPKPQILFFYGCFRGLECVHDVPRPSPIKFAISDPRFPCLVSGSDRFPSISDKFESLISKLFSKKSIPGTSLRPIPSVKNDRILIL